MKKVLSYIVMVLMLSTITMNANDTFIQTDTLLMPYLHLNQLSTEYLEERNLVHVTSNEEVTIIYNEADINRIKETNKTGNQFVKVYVFIGKDRFITSLRILVHEGIEMTSGSYPVTLYFNHETVSFEETIRLILISTRAVFNEDKTHVLDAYDVYLTPKQIREIKETGNLETTIIQLAWARVFAIEDNQEIKDIELEIQSNIDNLGVYPVKLKVEINGKYLEKIIYVHTIEELAMVLPEEYKNDIYYYQNNITISQGYWLEKFLTFALFVGIVTIPLYCFFKQSREVKELLESSEEAVDC